VHGVWILHEWTKTEMENSIDCGETCACMSFGLKSVHPFEMDLKPVQAQFSISF
jgi:hypothetical protein